MDKTFKSLPPEERIKKLKELEEKKKQEIAEAEELIKESEKEMTGRDEWLRKVPIPEIGVEDIAGLSEDGKELLKTHKGLTEKQKPVENFDEAEKTSKTKKTNVKSSESLEEAISQESISQIQNVTYNINLSEQQLNVIYQLSEEPVANLYSEMRNLNQQVGDKGYASRQDVERATAISSALEKRIENTYSGTPTEEVAARTMSTTQMSREVLNMYKGGAGADKPQNSYHSGGKTQELYK